MAINPQQLLRATSQDDRKSLSVPLWRMRVVLQKHGLFDTIDAYVTANKADIPELFEVWNYGNFIDRNSGTISAKMADFGLTNAQVDALFLEAAQSGTL